MTMQTHQTETSSESGRKRVEIDLLYLDLETCSRCIGTDHNVTESLAEAGALLEAAGVEVLVRKTLVETEGQARDLGVVTSPTIRVNGRDIALEFRESRCEPCEAIAGHGPMDCRVWVYQGQAFTAAPKAMILDAVLRAIYGGGAAPSPQPKPFTEVPENLRRFFAGKAARSDDDKAGQSEQSERPDQPACCDSSRRAACCAADEQEACCGTIAEGDGRAGGEGAGCGCR